MKSFKEIASFHISCCLVMIISCLHCEDAANFPSFYSDSQLFDVTVDPFHLLNSLLHALNCLFKHLCLSFTIKVKARLLLC
ncbi:unnamed protein product [Spodoptera littoralis]|uniref:Secreted protein n=1 Tax=Spodoptera littoralis TaxID=7109 RepID=A0A9P0I9D6_SPOLI|nr:unnamed protein product [Spodoptera littoralis]CAH1643479.1 unnamed protein product [Spodoptera littoralis]